MRPFRPGPIPFADLRIFLLFLGLFVLLFNGRMDSGDANAQLQAALILARTGGLGADSPNPDNAIQSLFVQSPAGRYYESHDVGNSLLMVPAAVTAVALSKRLPGLQVQGNAGTYNDSALILAKTLCSLTETLFSAVACYFLYLVFNMFLGQRMSVALALLFPFGTYFAAYFRSAWDVVPACDACCILLYFLIRMYQDEKLGAGTPLLAALWCGIACLFRFSLAPFFGLNLAIVFWQNRQRLSGSTWVLSVATFAVTLLPTLVYNQVRMGSFFKPATMSSQFADQNGLTNDVVGGALGLLVSPNRGMFVFSPILLLLFALPWCWQRMPPAVRKLLMGFAPGVLFYFLLIARLRNWGAAGWGPRYLLPVLPILYLACGFAVAVFWHNGRTSRMLTLLLILSSIAVAAPAMVVNYTDAMRMDMHAMDSNAVRPRQIDDTWAALYSSVTDRPTGTPDARYQASIAEFPDLAATRVADILRKKSVVAEAVFALFYLGLITSLVVHLLRQTEPGEARVEWR